MIPKKELIDLLRNDTCFVAVGVPSADANESNGGVNIHFFRGTEFKGDEHMFNVLGQAVAYHYSDGTEMVDVSRN